jgi:hypothetical protein
MKEIKEECGKITNHYTKYRFTKEYSCCLFTFFSYFLGGIFMSLMSEYIERKLSVLQLHDELRNLIKKYNKIRKTYLFVYAGSSSTNGTYIQDSTITMDDYHIIHDLLKDCPLKKLDFYIETQGGRGDAAEEIVRCLRNKFDHVSFVISGEAKSAGTIIILSGDDILMTKTGSLGPIDAQVTIGRSRVSAYDYLEWVKEKQSEAAQNGRLNPFDATMIAQISPGELNGVINSLKFAEDLAIDWLPKYKFKNWNTTETNKTPVTLKMKEKRAREIAEALNNHAKWRSHGRSIKINDLEEMGLKVTKIDDDPALSDIVYRIQTVIKMILSCSSTYKIYSTENQKITKQATPLKNTPELIPGQVAIAKANVKCPKCNTESTLYLKFVDDPKIDSSEHKKGAIPFPKDNILHCKKCKATINLSGIRNDLEQQIGKKSII